MRERLPKATHPGTLRIGDIEFEVAVLDDANHSRIVTESNFMEAMGMYRSGALSTRRVREPGTAPIPLSLAYKNLRPFVDEHFGNADFAPIRYRNSRGNIGLGLPAQLIPTICEIWIDADKAGALKGYPRQKIIAEKADVLLRGFAHIGIIALVDEVTGFQEIRDRETLQKILDKYLLAEHARWAKRFPDEFYRLMFKLKGWQWIGLQVAKPSVVGRYTNHIVYSRLAPGVLDELRRLNPKNEHGRRSVKHHQFFTEDIGHPALQAHLYGVIGLMRAATTWDQFQRMIQRAYPKINTNLEIPFPEDEEPASH